MAHGRNKYQSRENRARVREILLRDWDPIGVYGISGATDEYDTYADKAYVMLMNERASAEAIAAYLFQIATEHIGITEDPSLRQKTDDVAALLVSLRPDFETH